MVKEIIWHKCFFIIVNGIIIQLFLYLRFSGSNWSYNYFLGRRHFVEVISIKYNSIAVLILFFFAWTKKKQKIQGQPDRSARLSGHPTTAPQCL